MGLVVLATFKVGIERGNDTCANLLGLAAEHNRKGTGHDGFWGIADEAPW